MAKHKHADLMKQYAEDASNHEFPYMLWQYKIGDRWRDLMKHPVWDYDTEYRRKPIEQSEFVKLSLEFMKPLKIKDIDPGNDQIIYPVFHIGKGKFTFYERTISQLSDTISSCGVFHTTEENARIHVDILNKVCSGELKSLV